MSDLESKYKGFSKQDLIDRRAALLADFQEITDYGNDLALEMYDIDDLLEEMI